MSRRRVFTLNTSPQLDLCLENFVLAPRKPSAPPVYYLVLVRGNPTRCPEVKIEVLLAVGNKG